MIKQLIGSSQLLEKWYKWIKLCWREKKLFPNKIRLYGSGQYLFADPFESRGLSLLLNKGTGQKEVKKFWHESIKTYTPDLVIDVGANYGEVIFNEKYPKTVKHILGVEANEKLFRFLNLSKNLHPDRHRMELINALASDKTTEDIPFYIDQNSSGRSSAMKENFVQKKKEKKVKGTRLDQLILSYEPKPETVLFKIDVEGYEPMVLAGMVELAKENIKCIGCIEFNYRFLLKNKIDVNDYLSFLNKNYWVSILGEEVNTQSIGIDLERIQAFANNENSELDLILLSKK